MGQHSPTGPSVQEHQCLSLPLFFASSDSDVQIEPSSNFHVFIFFGYVLFLCLLFIYLFISAFRLLIVLRNQPKDILYNSGANCWEKKMWERISPISFYFLFYFIFFFYWMWQVRVRVCVCGGIRAMWPSGLKRVNVEALAAGTASTFSRSCLLDSWDVHQPAHVTSPSRKHARARVT